ncbi:MAG: thermonuclease family protein [Armatimonadetes bacterium]|nr:thermonuclease family protein [Armatimonadota bacterium]
MSMNRRQKLLPFLLLTLFLLASSVIFSGCTGTGKQSPDPAAAEKYVPALVTKVIDGDTFWVRLTDGREEKVRLIGVDTPESTREVEPYGKEAAAYTKKRLEKKTVYLELDVEERDKYDRLLAYVWLSRPKNGGAAEAAEEVRAKMFNAELLLNGYAQVLTVPPNVKYAELFTGFQREAREKKKGLW